MNTTDSPGTDRSQFLQTTRFVAAALVLFTHTTFYYHERVSAGFAVWTPGAVGVPMFFVISGIVMVISAQRLQRNALGARKFLVRRLIRIVPLWWLAVSIKVVVGLAQPGVVNHNHVQLDWAVKSYMLVPYFNDQGAVVPLHGVGWTLLHEMYFYLLFALALLCGRRPAMWVSAVIVAVCWAGTRWTFDSAYWAVASSFDNLHFVLGMALGSLINAGLTRQMRLAAAGALAAAACLLQLLPAAAGLHFTYSVLLALGAGVLALYDRKHVAALRVPDKLGDSSYSLYLFHPFIAPAAVLLAARTLPGIHPNVHLLCVVVLTIASCHVLHLVAEVPLVRWARRAFDRMPRLTAARAGSAT